ncbi:MAG: hypothetical protein H0W35_05035 [Actinobacteria bacterium]|nr:hypothetical protein [Actinomycetota bacterium]
MCADDRRCGNPLLRRRRVASRPAHTGCKRLRDLSGPPSRLWICEDHTQKRLNQWWEPRNTGFHDHSGSCVGVHVLEGRARNEALVIGGKRHIREYEAGDSFSFPGTGIHRMEHDRGTVTIHVYSPPISAIGHYDVVDGELRRESGSPDEGSPPSPALAVLLAQP